MMGTKELTAWDKLNDKQKQFVINRLKKMPRIDAYMDAYGMESREVAKTAVCRLMSTNVNVKEVLDKHFDDCIGEAKEILREEAPESARAIVEIRDMGNREYAVRLQAAMFNLKAVGADVPSRVQVDTGDTAPGLVIIGVDVFKYPPPLGKGSDEQGCGCLWLLTDQRARGMIF